MPRGLNTSVNMCIDSGVCDDEVEDAVGDLALERHRVRLLGVDEVGELDRVADEEDAEVVADQVPVAVLGVELDREAARVAQRLGGVAAAGDRREAHGDLGPLARLLEQLGARVLARSARRRPCPSPRRSRTRRAAGVDDALRDALAVEVADLLEEVVVLERRRAAGADGARVLVVGDGMALAGGQDVRSSVMRAGLPEPARSETCAGARGVDRRLDAGGVDVEVCHRAHASVGPSARPCATPRSSASPPGTPPSPARRRSTMFVSTRRGRASHPRHRRQARRPARARSRGRQPAARRGGRARTGSPPR